MFSALQQSASANGSAPGSVPIEARVLAYVTDYGVRAVAAILILLVGVWLSKRLRGLFTRTLENRGVDRTLTGFLSSMLYGALMVFVVITAVGQLGVQTTSFVAVIGAAGLAVGLALQGSLSNFASGVLLILFKPFKAGDVIRAGGEAGTVVQVGILTTELRTPDNMQIIMPNASVLGSSITNVSAYPTRRVDMTVGVGYRDDLNKAKRIMAELLNADERVLAEPAVTIAVANLGDSSVDFVVRPWVNSGDYWDVKFDFTKAVKEAFDAEGISIPFPQRDLHVFQEAVV